METEDKLKPAPLRSQDAIIARIRTAIAEGYLFITDDLVAYLPFDRAKEFLSPEVKEERWEELQYPLAYPDRSHVLDQMKAYMQFAWDKANDGRGLSALRSMEHYMAWAWLIGDDSIFGDLARTMEGYGQNNLRELCEYYGWDAETYDRGKDDRS